MIVTANGTFIFVKYREDNVDADESMFATSNDLLLPLPFDAQTPNLTNPKFIIQYKSKE